MVTRDDQLAEAVKKEIANVFESVFSIKGDEVSINDIKIIVAFFLIRFSVNAVPIFFYSLGHK